MTEPIRYGGAHRTMPEGYIRAAEAAALLNMTTCKVGWLARMGFIPTGEDFRPIGSGSTYRIYKREDILAYAEKTGVQQPSEKVERITPTDLALLSRLRHYANSAGYVGGDATDIILGNPARPADWQSINALAKAGALEWHLDNWDRLAFTLAREGGKP